MRPIIAIVLSAAILLGVHGYLRFAESVRAQHAVAADATTAAGIFSADITLTFAAEADSFSVEPTSLLLRQREQVLFKREGLVPAGEPLVVSPIENIVEGANEFYFECIPREEKAEATENQRPLSRAVRVRIFRDGQLLAENTFWSEPGIVPRGVIRVEVPRQESAAPSHDH